MHTPGPWIINTDMGSAVNANGGKKHVAMVNFYNCADDDARVGEAEHCANSRLIAAAPDLLEACEDALAMLDNMPGDDGEVSKKLRAAIAKALGE